MAKRDFLETSRAQASDQQSLEKIDEQNQVKDSKLRSSSGQWSLIRLGQHFENYTFEKAI
jgi:hypothetical protein